MLPPAACQSSNEAGHNLRSVEMTATTARNKGRFVIKNDENAEILGRKLEIGLDRGTRRFVSCADSRLSGLAQSLRTVRPNNTTSQAACILDAAKWKLGRLNRLDHSRSRSHGYMVETEHDEECLEDATASKLFSVHAMAISNEFNPYEAQKIGIWFQPDVVD
ncbi:hypothetical protein BDBG_03052 [Blastomyces gilchristii SLH14081]|uniref:Uncharacterized protein n=1 Tax=Blastomyces gilchristii (strain SLH14081) TaxID=559298 RepID=A0A179UFU8_BLAGS|nr:uncharacterized protein BDBG_03052 [Blastomyces gilchristii SLH14081]OAT06916.1 hypothetical protein BDBG_03052 [Blastomyces gilchristii SLH14081]